jgi:3-hydroxybutyryl-CoA dehydrogenase
VNGLAPIACLGAGRMARGIAVAFAYAGHAVTIIDAKAREPELRHATALAALGEVRAALSSLAALGLFATAAVADIAARVRVEEETNSDAPLAEAAVIFEAVPELPVLKREVLTRCSARAGSRPIIASTTSTILVDDLAPAVTHPQRFLNAHWLNPAFLVPLVEVSPGARTDPEVVGRLTALLEGIGKVPVICAARPGYIVPRIQALAMNEAARLVEEGVASAADIDKAVKYGFAFRFASLGLLEFIDYGGGDILYHASRYLAGALGSERYACPQIVASNMEKGDIGLKTGRGFLDYGGLDIDAYRHDRLKGFVEMLKFMGLARPPMLEAGGT